MPVKEKLSRISLYTLIPSKPINRRITIKEEPLSSKPFVISPKRNIHTKFFGRVKELDYIRTLYSQMLQRVKDQNAGKEINLKPIAIAISGEAGIGKSRLVSEFVNQIRRSIHHKQDNIISGRNLSTGQNPYGLFSKIPGSIWQSNMKDSDYSNNVMINNSIKEFIFKSAQEANKHNMPLVLVMEDMQWVDESSVAALEHVMKSINLFSDQTQPQILFVLNFRNKFRPSKILRRECDYREVELKGFTEEETDGFISSIAPGNMIEKNRQVIASRSDGNPFNIEEWCGLFDVSRSSAGVPGTVKELLVEKVSGLSEEERIILTIASVLGRKFDIKLINEILNRAGKEKAIQETTNSLVEKRYFLNLTGNIYEFRHDILQETIYHKLKSNNRQNIHLLAGKTIESIYSNELSSHYYELARHYVEARRQSKSIEYLEKAGDKAKREYEYERAMKIYGKLIGMKTIEFQMKLSAMVKLAETHKERSEWNKAIQLYSMIKQYAKNHKDSLYMEAIAGIADIYLLKNDYDLCILEYRKVIKKFSNTETYLKGICGTGRAYLAKGDFHKAKKYFYKLNSRATESGNSPLVAKAYEYLGKYYRIVGKYEKALACYDACKKINDEANNKPASASLSNKIGGVYFNKGDYENALGYFERSIEQYNRLSSKYGCIHTYSNVGSIYLSKQEYKLAFFNFSIQLKLAKEIGDEGSIASALGGLGNVLLFEGKYDEALKFYVKALEINTKLKKKVSISHTTSNIGLSHYYMGEFKDAVIFFEVQLKMDKRLNNKEGITRGLINLSNCSRLIGDVKSSERNYKKAISLAKQMHLKRILAIAVFNLAEMYFDIGKYCDAEKINEEGGEIARRNMYSIETFNYMLLKEKINAIVADLKSDEAACGKAIAGIMALMEKDKDHEKQTTIYFELWKIAKNLKSSGKYLDEKELRERSMEALKECYRKKPYFYFTKCINEIRKAYS